MTMAVFEDISLSIPIHAGVFGDCSISLMLPPYTNDQVSTLSI